MAGGGDRLQLTARSISRSVSSDLRGSATVLAVFGRACQLQAAAGNVVALVLPQIGNGPLNVVVEAGEGVFGDLCPGLPARLHGSLVRVGGLEVVLDGARIWEPRPDWPAVRARYPHLLPLLVNLRTQAFVSAPADSLLALLSGARQPSTRRAGASLPAQTTLVVAQQAAAALKRGWAGEEALLPVAAAHLAGLGPGLTPAGDDFLAGVMLWSWLAHPQPQIFCASLVEAAVSHTTTLSAAFLQAAARGECSQPWHRLLQALAAGDQDPMNAAVTAILAHGHTSGADALAGFLWLAGM